MHRISKSLQFFKLINEPEELLEEKMNRYRTISGVMFFLLAIQGTFSWIWDYYIDATGAQSTIGLRLCFLCFTFLAFAFKYIRNRKLLEFICLASGLLSQLLFILVMNHLENGMIYILAIFVFFLVFPLFLFQGFSFSANIICTLCFAAFPQLMALIGVAHNFQHPEYVILIWPAAFAMIITHYLSAQNYRLRYESEQALTAASNTDYLTGVSNRRHFMPLLQNEIIRGNRYKRSVCLLMLDIDHFKMVNDTHGHLVGDLVICAVANICRQSARQIDVVARMGGEEFGILLIETELQGALVVAERIRHAVENNLVRSSAGVELFVTVSIGVAQQSIGIESEEKLIELADKALYQAKNSGRNCIVQAQT